LLIQHALATGDDPDLIWRAENVLLEPADSLPHDDHLHLRVACSPDAVCKAAKAAAYLGVAALAPMLTEP
jgi:hypothetical protein